MLKSFYTIYEKFFGGIITMSKYLKGLIIACLAVCMSVCLGIFAAACTNGEGEGEGAFPSSVSITVKLDDDTPVKDVWVGICAVKDDGTLGLCLTQVATNAQGVVTFALDESNGKNYEVHLSAASLPSGYIYADESGEAYGAEEGIRIDVTKTPSLTVKLKKTATATAVTLDTLTTAETGKSYAFTATEAGDYLVMVSKFSSAWKLDNVDRYSNFAEVTLAANASTTINVDANCSLLVSKAGAVGSLDNPYNLTLGTEQSFSIRLIMVRDPRGNESLSWGLYDGIHFSFTSTEAGTYKITVTSPFDGDEIEQVVSPVKDSAYPSSNDNGSWSDIKANTEYKIGLDTSGDYSSFTECDVINYTIKVEYVQGGGEDVNQDLSVGNNTITAAGEYYFETTDYGDYVITVSGLGEKSVWTVNNSPAEGNTSKTVTYDANTSWLAISVDGACTINIAKADSPAA